MGAIDLHTLQTFTNGRRLCLAVNGGHVDEGIMKSGAPYRRLFSDGALTVADSEGHIVAGPQNFEDIEHLASAILEGDNRALTTPGGTLLLASAVLALISLGFPTPHAAAAQVPA